MRRVTADSNIYISALNFGGKPLRLLELARAGQVEVAISNAIITETSRILYIKFDWAAQDIREAVDQILGFTHYVHPTERLDVVSDDADDNRVLECAVAGGSEVVITGDVHLLTLREFRGISITSVSDFLARFDPGTP